MGTAQSGPQEGISGNLKNIQDCLADDIDMAMDVDEDYNPNDDNQGGMLPERAQQRNLRDAKWVLMEKFKLEPSNSEGQASVNQMRVQDEQLEELARKRIEASRQQQDNRLLGKARVKRSRYDPSEANRITVPKHSSPTKKKVKDNCKKQWTLYNLANEELNVADIRPSQSMFQIEDKSQDKLLQTPCQDDEETPQSQAGLLNDKNQSASMNVNMPADNRSLDNYGDKNNKDGGDKQRAWDSYGTPVEAHKNQPFQVFQEKGEVIAELKGIDQAHQSANSLQQSDGGSFQTPGKEQSEYDDCVDDQHKLFIQFPANEDNQNDEAEELKQSKVNEIQQVDDPLKLLAMAQEAQQKLISEIQGLNQEDAKLVCNQIIEESKEKPKENDGNSTAGHCLGKDKAGGENCPYQEERRNSQESVQQRRLNSEPNSPQQNSEKSRRSKGGVCPFGFHLLGQNLSQHEENKSEMIGKDMKTSNSARLKNEEVKENLEMEYQAPCQMTFDCKEQSESAKSSGRNSQEIVASVCQSENQAPGTLVNVAINAFKDFNRNQSEVELKSNNGNAPSVKQSASKIGSELSVQDRDAESSVITDQQSIASSSSVQPNLYQQLGGDRKMSLFVDYFLDGVMSDNELACYHAKFQDPYEMELLKFKLVQFFKFKLDGQQHYIGRDMYEVHKNLGITDYLFDKACVVFTQQLRRIKPKMPVFREFIKRISDLRPCIVIPLPKQPENNEEELKALEKAKLILEEKADDIELELDESENQQELFDKLGRENGIRSIVCLLLQLSRGENQRDIFANWKEKHEEVRVTKYTYLMLSLVDENFQWMCTSFSDSLGQMQIQAEDFETYLDFVREACRVNQVDARGTAGLVQILEASQAKLCIGEIFEENQLVKTQTLVEQLESTQSFESFVQEFLLNVNRNEELTKQGYFKSEENQQELISRISKILITQQNGEELQLDQQMLENLPENSTDPFFLAGEVFKETLLSFRVDEETANSAKEAFLSLRREKVEEYSMKIQKIASKLDLSQSMASIDKKLLNCEDFSFNKMQSGEQIKSSSDSQYQNQDSENCNLGSEVLGQLQSSSDSNEQTQMHKGLLLNEQEKMQVGQPKSMADLCQSNDKKFTLDQLLPFVSTLPASENISAKQIEKHGLQVQTTKDNKSKAIIHESEIGKYQDRHKLLLKRFMFLNSRALLAYKDKISFYSYPQKPWLVIPLGKIENIAVYTVNNMQQLSQIQNGTQLSELDSAVSKDSQNSNDEIHVLEVRLSENYSRVLSEISESNMVVDSKNSIRHRQQKQAIQTKSNSKQEGDEKILLFTDSKKKVIRNWQKKIAAQVVKISQNLVKYDKEEVQEMHLSVDKSSGVVEQAQ